MAVTISSNGNKSIAGRANSVRKTQRGPGVGGCGESTPQCMVSMGDQAREGSWASGEGPRRPRE